MGKTSYTKLEKKQIVKSFKDAEDRIMKKIAEKMQELSKDTKLKRKMEKEIYENYKKLLNKSG
jgi:predicted  nucleic acid-binding Zn-ribbon protein